LRHFEDLCVLTKVVERHSGGYIFVGVREEFRVNG
jgi:hypothetical protein